MALGIRVPFIVPFGRRAAGLDEGDQPGHRAPVAGTRAADELRRIRHHSRSRWIAQASSSTAVMPARPRAAIARRRMRPVLAFSGDRATLWRAVLASNSPAGLFPPVLDRGQLLVDGAIAKSNLEFPSNTSYLAVATGTHNVKVNVTGTSTTASKLASSSSAEMSTPTSTPQRSSKIGRAHV